MGVTLRPLQDRVLVKQLEEEERTKGGIIIPDTAKEKPYQGKIVAVGNGKKLDDGGVKKPEVKKGDLVLFEKYAGATIKLEGDEYMILREDEILAIIEK